MKKPNILFRGTTTATMVLAMVLAAVSPAAAATYHATIDFEDLAAGTIVGNVAHDSGISGDDAGGYVAVYGHHPTRAGNFAMIFDANCGGSAATCSGDDSDLYNPALSKVLIISEDLDPSDPDDADVVGAIFSFDFSNWGDGVVNVDDITVQDIEAEQGEGGAQVQLYSGGGLVATVPISATGDGVSALVDIGVPGVDYMEVDLNGSGSIDNINLSWETEDAGGGQGCTPGYWKQTQHFDSWVGYSPTDSFDTVFGITSTFDSGTLLDGLKAKGGGEYAFARHAVAALLDAANPDVDYYYSTGEVIFMVQAAYVSSDFENTKDLFAVQNELGCSLN